MRCFALSSILACSLVLATVPQGALAAAPTKAKTAKKKKGKDPGAESPAGEVPEPGPGDSQRVGRIFIDANGLGDAGPVLAGRTTRVAEGAFEAESVKLTDAPAGPELRVTLRFRDSGGYQAEYEIVYDGDVIEDGSGSFECQLCTEDELVEKVEALARQVAPKMMVPKEPEEEPDPKEDPDPKGDPDGKGPQDPIGDENPGRLEKMGKAGVGLLVVGGLASVAGVVLLARHSTGFEAGDPNADKILSTHQPGGGVLGGGLGLVIVGAVLLGIDRKRAKKNQSTSDSSGPSPKVEASVHPWFGGRGGGLGVTGRF